MTLLEKYVELFHRAICTKDYAEKENIKRLSLVIYEELPLDQKFMIKDIVDGQVSNLICKRNLIRKINRKWWVKYYETPMVNPGTYDSLGFEGPGQYRWQRKAERMLAVKSSKRLRGNYMERGR